MPAVCQHRDLCHFTSRSGSGSHKKNRQRFILPFSAVKTVFIQFRVGSKNGSGFCRIHGRSSPDPDDKIRIGFPGGFACLYTGLDGRILAYLVKNGEIDIFQMQQFRYIFQCAAFLRSVRPCYKDAAFAEGMKQRLFFCNASVSGKKFHRHEKVHGRLLSASFFSLYHGKKEMYRSNLST